MLKMFIKAWSFDWLSCVYFFSELASTFAGVFRLFCFVFVLLLFILFCFDGLRCLMQLIIISVDVYDSFRAVWSNVITYVNRNFAWPFRS